LPGDLGAARAKESSLPRLQAAEIKNGRLAMIGMASFFFSCSPSWICPYHAWILPSSLKPHEMNETEQMMTARWSVMSFLLHVQFRSFSLLAACK